MGSHKHTFADTYLHIYTAQPVPSYPCTLCLSPCPPMSPGSWTHCLREPLHVPWALGPQAAQLVKGCLVGADNSAGSQKERVGFDGEPVQMVAASPRCCMETNKQAAFGNLAPAWLALHSGLPKGRGSDEDAVSVATITGAARDKRMVTGGKGSSLGSRLLQSPVQLGERLCGP